MRPIEPLQIPQAPSNADLFFKAAELQQANENRRLAANKALADSLLSAVDLYQRRQKNEIDAKNAEALLEFHKSSKLEEQKRLDRTHTLALEQFGLQKQKFEHEKANPQGKAPPGYRFTASGNMEAIPGGPADEKKAAKNNSIDSAFALYETARDGLISGLSGSTTGPFAGRIPAVTAKQQIAEGGVAAMAPVLKQLFRVSGEGVFTDRDQELLLNMVPTRKDHPEARKTKIENIDRIVRAKLGATAARKGPSADDLFAEFGL